MIATLERERRGSGLASDIMKLFTLCSEIYQPIFEDLLWQITLRWMSPLTIACFLAFVVFPG